MTIGTSGIRTHGGNDSDDITTITTVRRTVFLALKKEMKGAKERKIERRKKKERNELITQTK